MKNFHTKLNQFSKLFSEENFLNQVSCLLVGWLVGMLSFETKVSEVVCSSACARVGLPGWLAVFRASKPG